ncbi:unnamed protein product [Dicrocoelium dendriticum]|nr:unnamed protein product [Dicrocoelium dendriticum]CAH8623111.1 unnamed protein product [Dicrocoelium dendriticum]
MRQMLQTPDLVLSKASGFSNSGSITLEHIFPTEQNFSGGLNYSQPVDRSRGKAKSEDSTTFSKIHVWSSDFPHNEQTIELDERYFCAPSPGLDRRQASCHFLEPECHYFLSSNEELESNKNFKFNVSTCTSNPTPEFIVHGQMSHARGNSEDIKSHAYRDHGLTICQSATYICNHFGESTSHRTHLVPDSTPNVIRSPPCECCSTQCGPPDQLCTQPVLLKSSHHNLWDPFQLKIVNADEGISSSVEGTQHRNTVRIHLPLDTVSVPQKPPYHLRYSSFVSCTPIKDTAQFISRQNQNEVQSTGKVQDTFNTLGPEECQRKPNTSYYSEQHRNMLHSMSFTSTSANNYFWQYNSQCKGPKAVRLIDLDNPVSSIKQGPDEPDSTADCPNGTDFNDLRGPCAVDLRTLYLPCCDRVCYTSHPTRYSHMAYPEYPFVTFEDPVQRRYDLVHCSKLRRGDGNDVTPNLSRLRAMGEELDYLNQKLAEHGELIMAGSSGTSLLSSFYSNKTDKLDMMHITSSPECQQIEKAKREKNKLASKICRLKKKAFHEANKIKYTALGMEYDELIIVITQLKRLIREHLRQKASDNPSTPSCSGYPVSKGILVNGYQPRVSEVYPKETMNDYQCQFTAPMSVAAGPTECARSSLLNTAIQIWEKTNVTRAAGRTDALVEEVLRLSRLGMTHHPLVRGMTVDLFNRFEMTSEAASSTQPMEADLKMKTEGRCSTFVAQSPNYQKQYEFLQPPKFIIPYQHNYHEEQVKHMF